MSFLGAAEIKDVEEADFIQVSAGQSLETPFMLKTAADLIRKITESSNSNLLPDFVYTVTGSIILSVNVINGFLSTF